MLSRAVRGDGRPARLDVGTARCRVDRAQMIDALGERDRERVPTELCAVLPALWCDRRKIHAASLHGRRCLCSVEGLVHHAGQSRFAGAVRGGETPRSFVKHPETDAAVGGPCHRLDRSVLETHGLVLALH
jgi:hypothetical protein